MPTGPLGVSETARSSLGPSMIAVAEPSGATASASTWPIPIENGAREGRPGCAEGRVQGRAPLGDHHGGPGGVARRLRGPVLVRRVSARGDEVLGRARDRRPRVATARHRGGERLPGAALPRDGRRSGAVEDDVRARRGALASRQRERLAGGEPLADESAGLAPDRDRVARVIERDLRLRAARGEQHRPPERPAGGAGDVLRAVAAGERDDGVAAPVSSGLLLAANEFPFGRDGHGGAPARGVRGRSEQQGQGDGQHTPHWTDGYPDMVRECTTTTTGSSSARGSAAASARCGSRRRATRSACSSAGAASPTTSCRSRPGTCGATGTRRSSASTASSG